MKSFPRVAEAYLRERIVNQSYARRVRAAAAGCRWVSVEWCNRYLRKRLSEVRSVTVAPERVLILSLWRFAYERGLVDSMPRGLVKIKVSRPPVRAWTLEQCCTAVKATFQDDGILLRSGAKLGVFLRCWLLLGYETGARQEDLWNLRRSDFFGDTVAWTQGKTGVPLSKKLTPACMAAVTAMLEGSPDGRVLGWAMVKESGWRRLRRFLKRLDLPGSSKWLRRSGATHVEILQPGKARLHLGHKTVGLAERFYIDWSQVRGQIPQTPVLLE
jgi:integrase